MEVTMDLDLFWSIIDNAIIVNKNKEELIQCILNSKYMLSEKCQKQFDTIFEDCMEELRIEEIFNMLKRDNHLSDDIFTGVLAGIVSAGSEVYNGVLAGDMSYVDKNLYFPEFQIVAGENNC